MVCHLCQSSYWHSICHDVQGMQAVHLFNIIVLEPISPQRYHIEHHKQMGEDGIDTDLPTRLELLCLQNVAGKAFFWYVHAEIPHDSHSHHFSFSTFQILFYALRPGFVRSQTPTMWHAANIAIQLLFDYAFVSAFGFKALVYFIMSSFFAGSLHPCAGHFIAEHYVWDGLNQETYSYYGPLNILAYNVSFILHTDHESFTDATYPLGRLS